MKTNRPLSLTVLTNTVTPFKSILSASLTNSYQCLLISNLNVTPQYRFSTILYFAVVNLPHILTYLKIIHCQMFYFHFYIYTQYSWQVFSSKWWGSLLNLDDMYLPLLFPESRFTKLKHLTLSWLRSSIFRTWSQNIKTSFLNCMYQHIVSLAKC